MKKDDPLFAPLELGPHTLRNRIVMGPLTRSRSRQPGNVPWELNAVYYRQRASAGLILSEATHVAPEGQGFHGSGSGLGGAARLLLVDRLGMGVPYRGSCDE